MEKLLRRDDLKWSRFRLFFGNNCSMIYILCISITMLFMVSCSSKPKEIPKEASYTFDINQEIGYNWDYLMNQVHNKNYNNKTYTTYQTMDNYKASDNEAMGAFFIDLASQILLKESLGLSDDLNSKEWTNGPVIYCGPVKYRHEKFDYVIFKSKAIFGGNTPKMDVATLGFVEYTKQYEDEDDKEKAEWFYASLVEHFNAGGLTVVESNDDYTKWSDGITNVGVYLHYVMEGLVFKDSIPCINVDFESVEQFPQTQQPKQKSNNSSKSTKTSSTSSLGQYTFTSQRLVTANELSNYSSSDLKIMRNEIYARHGYIFKKGGEMESYFKKQPWYQPQYSSVDKYLSTIEKQNIATILKVEKQRG